EKAKAFEQRFNAHLAEEYADNIEYKGTDDKAEVSRASSGGAIKSPAEKVPFLWGASADLSGSNKTMIDSDTDFMPENRAGRNIWFGVREFAMAAMMNGIALHGGTKVYAGTFFVFTDYLKAAVRRSEERRVGK